ncbi:MAG: phosphatase PAP2 family protein [Candidatus Kapabacteria bacterium]|nr:phosphatase PAP2 family protein [Candidatus Kapabacteria bacterium]
MIDHLYNIDVWLFYAINHGFSNDVFDLLIPIITTTKWWYPVYTIGVGWLLFMSWRQRHTVEGRRYLWCVALLLLSVAILDQASHRLLKEVIQRERPYQALGLVHQLVGSGGGSFPSNHAMNNAAVAVILSWFFPRTWVIFWAVAISIAFSRIYCGVHYPSDVLGGLVIGAIGGWAAIAIARRWMR